MEQLELNIIGCIDGPRPVSPQELAKIGSYREACIACWINRRIKNMTKTRLAELTGMRPSHIPDYFAASPIDGNGREQRDMPGKFIAGLERAAGNTIVSQWQAAQTWSRDTIREMLDLETKAA